MRKFIATRIYNCGGTAFSRGALFQIEAEKENLEHLSFCYIDTSGSDLHENIKKEELMLINGLDGAGKDRRVIYPQIVPHVPAILSQFPPEDFNIIFHSAGGGSGSSIGPAIAKKFLDEGKDFVVIMTGSIGSKIEVKNSIGTIQTYRNFAAKAGRNVTAYYRENNRERSRTDVNNDIKSALFLTSLVLSSENKGIDSADLKNLINFDKVVGCTPSLSSFDFHCCDVQLPSHLVPQAVATLFAYGESSADDFEKEESIFEYRADGFLSERRTKEINGEVLRTPINMVVYDGDFQQRVADLEIHLQRFEAISNSRTLTPVSLNVVEADNDDGVVF